MAEDNKLVYTIEIDDKKLDEEIKRIEKKVGAFRAQLTNLQADKNSYQVGRPERRTIGHKIGKVTRQLKDAEAELSIYRAEKARRELSAKEVVSQRASAMKTNANTKQATSEREDKKIAIQEKRIEQQNEALEEKKAARIAREQAQADVQARFNQKQIDKQIAKEEQAQKELAKQKEKDDKEAAKLAEKQAKEAARLAEKQAKEAYDKSPKARVDKLAKKFGNILTSRVIRGVIKSVANAFKEGFNNLYQWSKLNNSGFSKTIDNLASSLAYLKNEIAAAARPIIEIVVPVIAKITDAIAVAIEQASKFFAIIFSKQSYTRATKQALEYASAINEVKNQLAGFDELEILSNNKSSLDYSTMFEEVMLDDAEIEGTLAFKIKEIFPDYSDISSISGGNAMEEIMVNGLLGAGLGFYLTGTGVGAGIGYMIGSALTISIQSIKTIVDSGIDVYADSLLKKFANELSQNPLMTVTNADSLLRLEVGLGIKFIIKAIEWAFGTKTEVPKTITDTLAPKEYPVTVAASELESTAEIEKVEELLEDLNDDSYKRLQRTRWQGFAKGGVPNQGSLFLAGEAGPELVTSMNGRSTVYNDDQLAGSLATANAGVVNAIVAMNNNLANVISKQNTSISINDVRLATNSQNMRYGR